MNGKWNRRLRQGQTSDANPAETSLDWSVSRQNRVSSIPDSQSAPSRSSHRDAVRPRRTTRRPSGPSAPCPRIADPLRNRTVPCEVIHISLHIFFRHRQQKLAAELLPRFSVDECIRSVIARSDAASAAVHCISLLFHTGCVVLFSQMPHQRRDEMIEGGGNKFSDPLTLSCWCGSHPFLVAPSFSATAGCLVADARADI